MAHRGDNVEVPQPHRPHPTDKPRRTPEQGGSTLPSNRPGTSDQEVTPEVERDIAEESGRGRTERRDGEP
jgi:hypothetical protein